jgi:hypothetical protein
MRKFRLFLGSLMMFQSLFFGANPVQAQNRMMDIERNWRKGTPNRRGNENSTRPPSIPRLGGIRRDEERERRDNVSDPATTGCPNGSFNVTFAPDGLSFSVLFDNFVASTAATSAANNKNTTLRCHLVIPMEIPMGMKMLITRIDYRGFASLPQNSTGVLRSTFAFKKSGEAHNVNLNYQFAGPTNENFVISSDVLSDQQAVSNCGGLNNLRVSNVLRIKNKKPADAMLTLDSLDGAAEQLVYFVSYSPCRN